LGVRVGVEVGLSVFKRVGWGLGRSIVASV